MPANYKRAHFPKPGQKPKHIDDVVVAKKVTKKTSKKKVRVEAKDGVQSEAKPSDSTESVAKTRQEFEKPLTYGAIDGKQEA